MGVKWYTSPKLWGATEEASIRWTEKMMSVKVHERS